ncbi:MAG TPA: hypothetical protein VJU16_00895 [Planctomycetota bacterium]|nr:hypothetical protein [Planctomycetota bacterium]
MASDKSEGGPRIRQRLKWGVPVAILAFVLLLPIIPCPRLAADLSEIESGLKEANDPPPLRKQVTDSMTKMHSRGCDYCGGSGRVSLFTKWFYPGNISYWN